MLEQEYRELILQIQEERYDQIEEAEPVWMPEESEIKQKMLALVGITNLTNTQSTKLADEIIKFKYLHIGKFKIMITRNNYLPNKSDNFNLNIWEEKSKTPNGMDCKIDYPLFISMDRRFASCSWTKLFSDNLARNLSLEVVVSVVRYLQVIHKLPSFI